MITQDLTVVRGDSESFEFHFTDEAGEDIDITGWTVFMTVTKNNTTPNDDGAIIVKTIDEHDDPTHGKTTITLSIVDTAQAIDSYFYDIQTKDDNGIIQTPMGGAFYIVEDSTKRTS